jgi:hypothetical protein
MQDHQSVSESPRITAAAPTALVQGKTPLRGEEA